MDANSAILRTGARTADQPRLFGKAWPVDRFTSLVILALAPPVAVALYGSLDGTLPLLIAALIVAAAWTLLFARRRGHAVNWYCVATAALFALLVPPATPLWQALLALSFGVVIAEQIFGGRGYGFIHPAVAALAFLFFSFPESAGGAAGDPVVALAAAPGAILLIATGLISWRIVSAVVIGIGGWLAVKGTGVPWDALAAPGMVLGVVFLVSDPVSAASTNAGRWVYGLVVGTLLVILGSTGDGIASPAAIVFAALLGSIFAPLIDRIVILLNVQRRRRRLG